jgi:hypothetical protein
MRTSRQGYPELQIIALQKLNMDDGMLNSSGSNSALKADQAGLRNRSPSKMTKYVECWGADKPFANITESTLAKNIGLTVSSFICGAMFTIRNTFSYDFSSFNIFHHPTYMHSENSLC